MYGIHCMQLIQICNSLCWCMVKTKINQSINQSIKKEVVSINVQEHDRNMTTNKFLKHNYIINQNDTWHGVKSLKNSLSTKKLGILNWVTNWSHCVPTLIGQLDTETRAVTFYEPHGMVWSPWRNLCLL